MRYLILSDIHANLESLSLVKEKFIPILHIDKIICLGDIVGYNADPGECLSIILHELHAITIRGNHDRAIGFNDFGKFSHHAKAAGLWTRAVLSSGELKELQGLEQGPKIIDTLFAICHGSPINEDKYILSKYHVISEFYWLQKTGLNLLFFGHTHYRNIFVCDKYADINNPAEFKEIQNKVIEVDMNKYYCINPGSLGQPRDGNPHACFTLFDSKKMTIETYRFRYPINETKNKILSRKVPYGEYLGARLEAGE